MRLGDRIAVMRGGRLVQHGRANELYRDPADLFVARLFSEINEVSWEVQGGALRTPIGSFSVPGLAEGEKAVLCIRQRSIRLVPAGQGQPGRVLHTRFLGDAAMIEIAVAGFERPLKALVEEPAPLPRGADVTISVAPESILVFPAEQRP
jgi:iron(III) transport system ATP-binding protein